MIYHDHVIAYEFLEQMTLYPITGTKALDGFSRLVTGYT